MFNTIFKKIKPEIQGILASILGLILILGTLGKLQILQSILNTIMIFVGLILLLWGIHKNNGFAQVKEQFHKKLK